MMGKRLDRLRFLLSPDFEIGEYIGLGNSMHYGVNLLAEVRDWDGDTMRGWVVNGAWEFDFTPSTGKAIIYTPWGSREGYGWEVVFRGTVPGKLEGYSGIMEYMDSHLGNHVIALWGSKVTRVIHRHTLKLKTACRAFMQVYRHNKTNAYKQTGHWIEEDDDDAIPF